MNTVKTEKGTELPLLTLKGKFYLQVAHRIQWLAEREENYTIDTCFPLLTDTQTICTAKVQIFNKEGKLVRTAMATKRETKVDFSDHTEKAETSAIGRAISLLGFGTQFAMADLEEGQRLADSPLTSVKKDNVVSLRESAPAQVTPSAPVAVVIPATGVSQTEVPKERTTFRMPKRPVTNGTAKAEAAPAVATDSLGLDS